MINQQPGSKHPAPQISNNGRPVYVRKAAKQTPQQTERHTSVTAHSASRTQHTIVAVHTEAQREREKKKRRTKIKKIDEVRLKR